MRDSRSTCLHVFNSCGRGCGKECRFPGKLPGFYARRNVLSDTLQKEINGLSGLP
jgi:hypothetical protein